MKRLEVSARGIALDLLRGARAEVVGRKYLSGFPPQYLEVDGVPVQLPPRETKEAPAVRVTYPDGFVALYVASRTQDAEATLVRAQEIVEANVTPNVTSVDDHSKKAQDVGSKPETEPPTSF